MRRALVKEGYSCNNNCIFCHLGPKKHIDLNTILEWVKENSIKLKFIDNSIDLESNTGTLMMQMMAAYFEFERKNYAFKTINKSE